MATYKMALSGRQFCLLNWRKIMKIVNIDNEKIKACFVFTVQNSEISVSTIMNKKKAEIAIFNKSTGELEKDKLGSISQAISWVHSFGKRD